MQLVTCPCLFCIAVSVARFVKQHTQCHSKSAQFRRDIKNAFKQLSHSIPSHFIQNWSYTDIVEFYFIMDSLVNYSFSSGEGDDEVGSLLHIQSLPFSQHSKSSGGNILNLPVSCKLMVAFLFCI